MILHLAPVMLEMVPVVLLVVLTVLIGMLTYLSLLEDKHSHATYVWASTVSVMCGSASTIGGRQQVEASTRVHVCG